jgi:excisionase family DNA binding protein
VADEAERRHQEPPLSEERVRQIRDEIVAAVRAELAGAAGLDEVSARVSHLEARLDTELPAEPDPLERGMGTNRLAYSVEDVAELLGFSKRHCYQLLREGKLPSVRAGARLIIPARELDEFLRGTWNPDVEDDEAQT